MNFKSRKFKRRLFIVLAVLLSVSLVIPLASMFRKAPNDNNYQRQYTESDSSGSSRVTDLESQLLEKPDDVKLLLELANNYYYARETERALETYERILAIDSSQMEVRYNAAVIYNTLGRYDEALKQLDAILKDNPNDLEALWLKGSVLANGKNNYTAAINTMEVYLATAEPGQSMETVKQIIASWRELAEQKNR